MAGTASVPTSLVEITISCRSLRDTDVLSKSDPMCIVMYRPFGAKKWAEYKRTECISNTLNPDFVTKIQMTYNFEVQQHLKFCIYDIDSSNPNMDKHDFLGEVECTLGQMAVTKTLIKPLSDKGCPTISCGNIVLTTEELVACKEELILQLFGNDFENTKWCGSIKPFLEFYKANEDGSFTLVHRTESCRSSLPSWNEFTVPMRSFCNADYDRSMKVIAKDFVSSGNHKPFGVFYTTVKKLTSTDAQTKYWVIDEEKKKRKGDKYKNSGIVEINKAQIRQIFTFLDYIKGGVEINAFIGIDFTASNGNPQDPSSLHYVNPLNASNNPNQYVKAISAVADIIEDYDSDKYFPVLGFGARLPPDFNRVSHEFFVNGHPTSPFCYKVQGILDAYYGCLSRVQLYGPTNFAPIIDHVANFARSHRNGDKYFILLIITDGIITDMPMTKEAIVNSSNLPLSIIIVGVGSADFTAMEELDGDTVRISSNGKYAERDIVQFVPFLNYLQGTGDPGSARLRLAREVLAEVPDQFISYMKENNIAPNPPKVNTNLLNPSYTGEI